MMEQSDPLLDEHHSKFLRGLEDGAVVLTSGWGSDVLHAGASSAEDVVDEGEL